MKQSPLFCIIYDSIYNSVFPGQVLKPLLELKNTHLSQKIIVISFEKKLPSTPDLNRIIPSTVGIDIIILKKIPFIGSLSIRFAAWQLKRVLHNLNHYQLRARGPLAGAVCLQSLDTNKCTEFMIQARGLLGAEYTYEHQQAKGLPQWWHQFRAWQYKKIESATFSSAHTYYKHVVIEAVSPALKDYLIAQYQVNAEHISIATLDKPASIAIAQRQQWRTTIRAELNIPETAHIYCYNGSGKSWQCPEESIIFFKQEFEKDKNIFLLILSQDKEIFEHFIHKNQLPKNSYHIMTVAHHKVLKYLSACDTGILLRKSHIVNWVSRPTKALEYQAAGLNIVHNNTIAWLKELNA